MLNVWLMAERMNAITGSGQRIALAIKSGRLNTAGFKQGATRD